MYYTDANCTQKGVGVSVRACARVCGCAGVRVCVCVRVRVCVRDVKIVESPSLSGRASRPQKFL